VQVSLENFKNAKGTVSKTSKKSPDAIVKERATNDSQGVFGFLKTINKKFSITFDEARGTKFRAFLNEEITSAAAKCNVQTDERCIEGPIPVECKSASCGTCWIGVLGGQEKLSEVQRLERKQMKVFGYNQPDDAKPFMRLSCQSKISGNVTLVIPPWNGVFGKKVYNNVEERELEPATTSAKKLREQIAEATNSSN
jgi:ferredoxin